MELKEERNGRKKGSKEEMEGRNGRKEGRKEATELKEGNGRMELKEWQEGN